MTTAEAEPFRCGSIAVVGRPNVGKSTLLNALIGARLSITSRKPQTTRHRIRGMLTIPDAQFVFVDTPGYQTEHRNALNRIMNRSVSRAIGEVDCALVVIEAGRFLGIDGTLLKLVPPATRVLLVANKADLIPQSELLPFLQKMALLERVSEIVPVSAKKRRGLAELLRTVRKYLPVQPRMFAEDQFTDRDERFLASELIREQLFRLLGEELPYGSGVVVEKFEELPGLRRIFASIIVEREGHKAMVIGAKGEKLKRISSQARLEMERLFAGKVYLEVWVKVRRGWTDDASALKRLGYE